MLNLQLISDKKPGARHNEDLFGFKGDTFWLLDGATTTDGPPLARDAHWLVHELDTALNSLAALDLDTATMAAAACTQVGTRWPGEATHRPVAAMAVWRMRNGQVEAAITGNVSLLVPVGGEVRELTDTRVLPAHVGASAALLDALAAGLQFESAEFQRLRRDMKERESNGLDINSDGWLATAGGREPENFCRFNVPCRGTLMAATDGFMELRRYLHSDGDVEFLRTICEMPGGLDVAMNVLRSCELQPNSGMLFPRTKRHDDATAVLLRLP